MKALFWKEFRQGRPLLIFAAALAVLIAGTCAVIVHSSPYYRAQPKALDEAVAWMLISVPVGLAFLAGAGLFSAEQDHGTVPLLLGLPLSRRRIWGAKVLAGAALAVAASLLLLLLDRLLLPGAFAVLPVSAYVPDLALWSLTTFSAAVFASVLVGHTSGAMGFGAILTGLVAAAAGCLCAFLGAPLLQYSDALDTALWAAAATPALLLGSALALDRGESLGSLRKWRFGAPLFLAAFVVTVLCVSGVARVATRYDRGKVANIDRLQVPSSAGPVRTLSLRTEASLVRFARDPGLGWRSVTLEEASQASSPSYAVPFRAQYQVLLDPQTGRELLHLPGRDATPVVCTADGRYAAAISAPRGLTWGVLHTDRRTLRIYDVRAGRQTYAVSLDSVETESPDWGKGAVVAGWSARGEYLIVQNGGGTGPMHFLTREGREIGTATLRPGRVTWSPTEEIAFGFDGQGRLCRVSPESREPRVIWTPPKQPESTAPTGPGPYGQTGVRARRSFSDFTTVLSISPDGKWLVIEEYRELGTQTNGRQKLQINEQYTWLVPAQGGPARLLWEHSHARSAPIQGRTWSADGKVLYALDGKQLLAWRPGQAGLTPTGVEVPIHEDEYAVLLTGARPGELIIWIRQWVSAGETEGRKTVGARALVMDAHGKLTPVRLSAEAKDQSPLGLDAGGRLLLSSYTRGGVSGRVQAMDLATGDTREVYP